MTSLHERQELARAAWSDVRLDARASQSEDEIADIVDARVRELTLDRIGDDLGARYLGERAVLAAVSVRRARRACS